jgi:hypothetical protein
LDSLAYPPGHRIVMSYQKKYVQPALLDEDSLVNRDAAIIFVDSKDRGEDHGFIPIRFARIVECMTAPMSTRIELRVEFGELIPPDLLAESSIRVLPMRPRPYSSGARPGAEYYFALEDTPVLRPANPYQHTADIWEDLAALMAKSHTLADTVLLSLSSIRNYAGKEQELQVYRKRDRVYNLRPNTIYEMDVRVFETALTDLEVRSSSDVLGVAQAFPTTVGGLGNYRVILSCKRTLETSLAVLAIDLAGDKAAEKTAKTIAPQVRNARPVYLVQIAPSKPLLGTFVVVAFAGLLFTSLSKDFFKAHAAAGLSMDAELAELVAKMVGSALLAIAAWLAFRKLPGGGG